MNLQASLSRLLDLEAKASGIPSADFKLGYLITLLSSVPTRQALQDEVNARILHLEERN